MNQIFYGCYQSNHVKRYKWQCRKFNKQDATDFTNSAPDKSLDNISLLIPINNNTPKILHKLILKNEIIKNIINIDVNE